MDSGGLYDETGEAGPVVKIGLKVLRLHGTGGKHLCKGPEATVVCVCARTIGQRGGVCEESQGSGERPPERVSRSRNSPWSSHRVGSS